MSRRALLRPAAHLVLAALGAAAVARYSGLDRALVLDVLLVYAAALALATLARSTASVARAEGESPVAVAARRAAAASSRPDALLRLEALVALASATAADFRLGLRPQLREAAAHRLRSRLAVDLDGQPERARRALGEEAWALLGPEAEAREPRLAAGPSRAHLDATVTAIERIGP